MIRPNLFIVGAAKCGTTSLHQYLSNHSNIFMSTPKELNFFSYEEIVNQNLYYKTYLIDNERDYLKLFSKSQGEKYLGESSVSYISYPNSAKKIKNYSPKAKIIILLRNPSQRAFSHYLMDKRLGYINLDFDTVILNQGTNQKEKLFYQQYIELGFYYTQVKRFFKLFGKKNVKIILMDDFINDTDKSLQDIFDFLIIKKEKINFSRKHNKFMTPNFFLIRFLFVLHPLRRVLSLLPRSLKDMIYSSFFSNKKPLLNNLTKEKLNNIYKSDIINLEKLIDRDLSKWYY